MIKKKNHYIINKKIKVQTMLKNYFKIALRSLWKNKFYTIINISGLAVGLATGIMLLLWVQNELSFDKFNKDYKHI
jgi:putative ABC transport system permease protein